MNQPIPASEKRHLLWNMIEPGDPYDIRQSLIAKVPGDRKIFMGDHLELVCLFQAAQIERLHESLREYGVKFKEVQRIDLDRHSYEVQIKQLMTMCNEAKESKEEIGKLKQFIRKQGLEMDDIRKKTETYDESLEQKYQQALGQLEVLYTENTNLKGQIQNLESRLEATRASHAKELQQLRSRLESDRRLETDREIAGLTSSFNIQRSQYEAEIRRLRERIEAESGANDQLRANIQAMNQSISEYETKLRQSMHVQAQLSEHQRKLRMLSKQLQRLQSLLSEKSKDSSEAQISLQKKEIQNKQLLARIQDLQGDLSQYTAQIRQHQKKLGEYAHLHQQLAHYQDQVALLTQEVERLNAMLRNKNNQNIELSSRLGQAESEMTSLKRQYKQIELTLRQSEFERERLLGEINAGNQQRSAQIRDLKQRISNLTLENEGMRRQQESHMGEYESKLNSLLNEVDRLNNVLKSKLAELKLKDSQIAEYNLRISQYQSQKMEILRRLNESTQYQRLNENLKSQIIHVKSQGQRVQSMLRATASQLQSENQSLRKKVRQSENLMNRTNDMERTVDGLKGELQAANLGLRSRNDENSKLRMQLSEVKQVNIRLSQEVEGTRRRLTDSLHVGNENNELKARVMTLSQQIQRLNGVLRTKLEQNRQLGQRVQRITDELGDFSNKEQSFKRIQIQLRQTIANYENEKPALVADTEKSRRRIQELQAQYSTVRREGEEQNYNLTRELDRVARELKNKERQLASLQEQYRVELTQNNERVLRDSNHRINLLQEEVSHLNDLLAKKSEELIRCESTIREKEMLITRITGENAQLNSRVNQLLRIRTAYEEAMATVTKLTNEVKEMQSKISQQGSVVSRGNSLEERIIALSAEIERLNKLIRERDQEITRLNRNEAQNSDKLNRIAKEHEEQLKILETRIRGEYTEALRRAQTIQQELRAYITNSNTAGSQMSQKDNQLREWRVRCQELQTRLEEQSRIRVELQKRVGPLSREIQRLNSVLRSKVEEHNHLTNLYNQLTESVNQQHDQERLNSYVQEIERLNSALRLKVNELNTLSQEYGVLQQAYQRKSVENEGYQNRISIMATEIERLNIVLKETMERKDNTLVEEIERLNNALRLKVIESQQWQDQVNRSGQLLKKQYNELHAVHQQVLRECQSYKRRVIEHQEKFDKLLTEFNRLESIIQRQKGENDFLKQENYAVKVKLNRYESLEEMNKRLNHEIERLNKVKGDLDQEIADMRIRYVDESALHRRLNEHLTLFVVLFAEIQSLRIRVKDKEKEVQEVRRSSLAFKI